KLPEPATGITQPTPQQPAKGNAVTAPAAPTQPAANRSQQRATPPQSGAQPPARAPGG
ncbi:rod shape-determining protein MreC, partial [Escherichia coli]